MIFDKYVLFSLLSIFPDDRYWQGFSNFLVISDFLIPFFLPLYVP